MKESKIVLKLTYHIIFITQNFHIPKSKKRYININSYFFFIYKLCKNYKRKHHTQEILKKNTRAFCEI